MAIARFDPFREFATLQDRMNRLFGDVYVRDEQLSASGAWVPPVDIFETEGHDLVIKAELPDLTREDIDVTVEHNTLTLRGTKKPPVDVKDEQYRRSERRYGTFSRSFTLPTTVDASKVAAEYRNGVLTVKLPFREEAKPRTINVEVAA
ncbi:MAG TPA: Hsp20/alpha crystallin family protein [Vicinamibacterales bacterium]|nr:Hsp20/alpha crystallin family protein [Vicinamibacterales bacterium]